MIPDRTVRDRLDVIGLHVADRRVLDVGVVDARRKEGESRQRVHKPDALFQQISRINAGVVGVDIDAEGVDELKAMGYQVHCGNAETVALEGEYDTIVAGEIIEHLDNPGAFLQNMKRLLAPGGLLIVTTPNPFYCKQVGKIWRKGHPQVHEEHTCWFDPITLAELMRRQGLSVSEAYWVQPRENRFKIWKQWFRGYFSHSFMFIARPAAD